MTTLAKIHQHNSGIMAIGVTTNQFLIEFRAHSTDQNSNLSQDSMTGEAIGSRREFITIILPNRHNIKTTFQILVFYSEVGISLSLHQRSFFLHWMLVNTETLATGQVFRISEGE